MRHLLERAVPADTEVAVLCGTQSVCDVEHQSGTGVDTGLDGQWYSVEWYPNSKNNMDSGTQIRHSICRPYIQVHILVQPYMHANSCRNQYACRE